tara:strand:- start:3370 stop:3741 length:372 start_codon:yes stop_codon:yes gene_type:complete
VKPKSHKVFKEGIAEKVGVHSSVVDEFINFYYEKVRENLSTLTDPNIFIDGLGTFSLRKIKIKKAIIKNKSYLGNLEKTTYNGYNKTILIEEKIKTLQDILLNMEKLAEDRKEFKKKRNETQP